jgi:hypothetical protein
VCRWCKVRLFRRYPDSSIAIAQVLDYIDFLSICRCIEAVLVRQFAHTRGRSAILLIAGVSLVANPL